MHEINLLGGEKEFEKGRTYMFPTASLIHERMTKSDNYPIVIDTEYYAAV
jgi:hypothetical protein